MVKARDSWVFQYPPNWKPPDLNGTGASHEPKKQGLMTSFVNPGSPFSPSLAGLPGFIVSRNPNSNVHHPYETTGSIRYSPYHFLACPPPLNPYLEGNASFVSHEPRGNNPTIGSPEKRFLVFDQSDKGTRLIYDPSSPLFQKSEVIGTKSDGNLPVDKGEHPTFPSRFDLNYPNFQEESGENQVAGEESEMHEDTEEINALLYSDDDYEHDEEDDMDEEDEVTSTGHTPGVPVQCCGKRNRGDATLDEVGDFGLLNKRQKPIGGEYNRFNPSRMESPLIKPGSSSGQESDANSSYVMSQAKVEDAFPNLGGDLSKTNKIRQTMKILEGIIPGAESKDPVVVLDEAIEYLKTMKLKARVLGMSFH